MIKKQKKILIILITIISVLTLSTRIAYANKIEYADSGFDSSYDSGGSSYDYGESSSYDYNSLNTTKTGAFDTGTAINGADAFLNNAANREVFDTNNEKTIVTYNAQKNEVNEVSELSAKVEENTKITMYLIIALIVIFVAFTISLIAIFIIIKKNKNKE